MCKAYAIQEHVFLITGEGSGGMHYEARWAGRKIMQGLEERQKGTEFKMKGMKNYKKPLS